MEKFLSGGDFTSFNGIAVNGICRITNTGSFDPTFNPGIGVAGNGASVNAIHILSNGSIIIGGNFTTYNTIAVCGLALLTANAGLDNTFNAGGTGFNVATDTRVNVITAQPDGKLLVGGIFTSYNGTAKKNVVRLNSNGSLDASFTIDKNSNNINAIVVRADGKIWCGGSLLAISPTVTSAGVGLFSSTGTMDASFMSPGINSNGTVISILPLPNNRIIIAGYFTSYGSTSKISLAKINADASLDASFDQGFTTSASFVQKIQYNSDSTIIYSGLFNAGIIGSNSVEKLTKSLDFDQTFNLMNGVKGTVKAFERQPDGKIIIAGNFTAYNGTLRSKIARITADGELDASYNPNAGANNDINAVVIQADGKIVVAGNFTSFNATATGKIARTTIDGTVDASFTTNNGTGANGNINVMAIQADGKIIIGGSFTSFNGNTANYLARLNSNGTFDNTFNIGSGGFGQVRVIRIQADGKILIGGDFQFFNSSTIARIARLNTDGTIDNTFTPTSTGANKTVFDIQVAADGSIFVAGEFGTYNGVNKYGIVKLSSLGVLDNAYTFNGLGYVYSMNLYPNGKILAGIGQTLGGFGYLLQRYNSNGSLESNTWNIGGADLKQITSHVLLGNGNKILLAGAFTSVNSVGRNRIARVVDATIAAVPLSLQSFKGSLQNNSTLLNWSTSNEINTDKFVVQRSIDGTNFTGLVSVLAKGNNQNSYQFTDPNIASLNTKQLYYRLKMMDKDGSFTYSSIVPILLNSKTSITIFPNPTKDMLWIQLQTSVTNEQVQLSVVDIAGKTVLQQSHTVNGGINSLPLNVSKLNAGTYLVKIIGNKTNEVFRFIKE